MSCTSVRGYIYPVFYFLKIQLAAATLGMDTGRVEISEMQYVNFVVFEVFLIEIVMKKCYISTLAKR